MYAAAYLMSCSANFDEGLIDHCNPSVYLHLYNQKLTADTYKYYQAILQPDWELFQESAIKEIRTLEKMNTREKIFRTNVKPGKRVLGGTWIFKRKRAPDGKILKHKARYFVQGDQQVAGVDYFESYVPVTMWSTV
jgi:Reverse transcriptase (RNA-dependent DNA polymerase)